MIKFFRHIRQTLIMENKTGKYLKYAVGEIVLVVLGILIALSINNWNEKRKAKQIENTLLTELQKSVHEDIRNINNVINRNSSYLASAEIVLNAIENNQIVNDSIANHLERSFKIWRVYFKTSAYNNLKEYGLHVIKDDKIRNSIITAYDVRAEFVNELYKRYDQFLYNVVEQELTERFEFKEIEKNEYGLFPINNDLNADHHRLNYLLIKSIDLQDQIIRATLRTLNIFEELLEKLKTIN